MDGLIKLTTGRSKGDRHPPYERVKVPKEVITVPLGVGICGPTIHPERRLESTLRRSLSLRV